MPEGSRVIAAKELLESYSLVSLQQLGRPMGIDIKGKSKSALVPLLARRLYEADRVKTSLGALEPVERYVLDRLILAGGEMTTMVLRAQLETEGKVARQEQNRYGYYGDTQRVPGSTRKPGSTKFEDIIARLGSLGLVFSPESAYGNKAELTRPGHVLFIPAQILRHLPPVTLPAQTAPPPATERAATLDALHRDVYMLLSFARDEPIVLTARNQIPKRKLVQIDESLRLSEGAADVRSEADLGRLPLLRAVLEELGLLIPSAGSLRLGDDDTQAPTRGVPGFLARLRGERQRQVFEAYGKTVRWSELSRLGGVAITPRTGIYHPHIVAARRRVLAELAELPAGQWIAIAHLLDRLRRRAYDLLLPRSWAYRSSYYYGATYDADLSVYYGSNPLGLRFESESAARVDWSTVEGGFIRVVVTEALFWLGLVDLGAGDATGEPEVFRITEGGAALLRGDTPWSPPPEPNVVVQPNFQIFAFEPTGEDVLYTLDRLARRIRSEQVAEYQLTRETVYAAQRSGMDTAEILDFLDRISGTRTIPQNVRRSLEEWGAQHERIVVRRSVSALQATDENVLDSLYADPELGRLLGRRVAPTMALVPAEHLDTIFARLLHGANAPEGGKSRCPLPALTEGNDAWNIPALTVDVQGRITFRQPVPSIFVQRALRPFTEEDADGSLLLTPGSLRRGARAEMKAEDMVAALESVHLGALPEEVKATIRRWAKNWGRGILAQVTLLQVESAEIMRNLLADPQIKPYLHSVAGAETLATVPRDQAGRVRSLLEERGMELQDRLTW